jgi:hypothetical protein
MTFDDVISRMNKLKRAELKGVALREVLTDLALDVTGLAEEEEGGDETFDGLLDHMRRLHQAKNADYGNSYDLAPALLGIPAHLGLLARMTDKLARACRIAQRGNACVTDEGLRDTLLDLANYALLTILALPQGEKAGD